MWAVKLNWPRHKLEGKTSVGTSGESECPDHYAGLQVYVYSSYDLCHSG